MITRANYANRVRFNAAKHFVGILSNAKTALRDIIWINNNVKVTVFVFILVCKTNNCSVCDKNHLCYNCFNNLLM